MMRCPSYNLDIFADGRVVFFGKENVQELDRVESAMSLDALRGLLNEFSQRNYLSFHEAYNTGAMEHCPRHHTDDTSVFTELTFRGRKKFVAHDLGCTGFEHEADLIYLENLIDTVVNSSQWVGP